MPSAAIAAPDASRRRRINAGRAAAPFRMPLAAKATTMSARVLSATDTKPSTTNCSATLPAAGSTNCGTKARKKAAVFGFSASTSTPSRNARRGSAMQTCRRVPAGGLEGAQAEPDQIGSADQLQGGEQLRACEHDGGDAQAAR